MRGEGKSARKVRVCGTLRADVVVDERSWDQVLRERGREGLVARRDLVVWEIRTRDMLGLVWLRSESCERKWRPTPPAPGKWSDFVRKFGFVVLEMNGCEVRKD